MEIDRVCFYLDDAEKWRDWFVRVMQFQSIASRVDRQTRTEVLRSGAITFVLSSPLSSYSPVAKFLRDRSPGVVDVAFLVPHLEAALHRAMTNGARVLHPIQQQHFPQGRMRWSQIAGKTPLTHTLVERQGMTPVLPKVGVGTGEIAPSPGLFSAIDHVVLNVAVGELEKTACWYEDVLGFQPQQTFAIQTPKSGLYSQVMVHPDSGVKLPINEPTSANSQIQEFLDLNRGAGVQHIALGTSEIVSVVRQLREAGLPFLQVPNCYYEQVQGSSPPLNLRPQEWEAIARLQILVDGQLSQQFYPKDNAPLLLQIFTQPIFAQPTFFFEIIERRDRAQGFGEGNFQALFEAIEQEQAKRGSLG